MNARDLTRALGGRWTGSSGMACCPIHDDRTPSLSIAERDGKLLVRCHAGCDQAAVWEALNGLVGGDDHGKTSRRREVSQARTSRRRDVDRLEQALATWRAAQPAPGTPVETYLRSRGISLPLPPTLRYHSALKHSPTGLHFPAIVAAVQAHDRRITAVHRTFLQHDGRGKANVTTPKLAKGELGQGAVRLAKAGKALGLAEGIETGLSAQQIFEIPCWAAVGSRLGSVAIPPEVIEVQVFGDNGGPGHEAAEKAAQRFQRLGHRVTLRFPPEPFGDWNDALQALGAA